MYEKTGFKLPPLNSAKEVVFALKANSALASIAYDAARGLYYRIRADNPADELLSTGALDVNLGLLAEMRRAASARGVDMGLLLLPNKILFDDAQFAAYSQNGRFFAGARNPMARAVSPLCRKTGMTCLDPFEVLRRDTERVAYPVDGHYTVHGARVIADFIYGRLDAFLGATP